ncbi:hypothetical protein J6590_035777 [Homalodisca vitripennis]|nr:hypothetical protein J6590_035777 [Homalodisca vitripennis]
MVRPLYPLYMRWGVTKLQVADLAGAQPKKSLSAIEQPSTSADSSIIEDTRVHDSLVNNANILETKEAEKEIDAEAEPSLEEGSSSDSAKSSNVQCSNIVTSDTVASANSNSCFFSNKKKKQFRYKIDPLRSSEKGQFKKSILLNFKPDTTIYQETLTKIESVLSSEVYYHEICLKNFRNQKRSLVKSPVRTAWHISREVHKTVYKEIRMSFS